MRTRLMSFIVLILSMPIGALSRTINVHGDIDVYKHADPQQILLQKKQLQLEEEKILLEQKKLNLQNASNCFQWELQTKERDELLQQQAMLKNDGKCCDHFCETRCKNRASNGSFCARHFREFQKGLKEKKYKAVSRKRFFYNSFGLPPS